MLVGLVGVVCVWGGFRVRGERRREVTGNKNWTGFMFGSTGHGMAGVLFWV